MLKFLRASTLTTKCVPLTRRCVHFEVKTTPNELARIFSAEGVPQAPLSAHIIKPVTFTAQGPHQNSSPMADALLKIDGVSKVMLSPDMRFTVTKHPDYAWQQLQPSIILTLNKGLSTGVLLYQKDVTSLGNDLTTHPPSTNTSNVSSASEISDNEELLENCIQEVLEQRVQPILQEDGGHVELKQYDPDTKTVWIVLSGACDGCPSASVTVKDHIESLLTYFFEEEVQAVRIWSSPENPVHPSSP